MSKLWTWKNENWKGFESEMPKKWKKFSFYAFLSRILQNRATPIIYYKKLKIFIKIHGNCWQNSISMLKSELWKYFSLFLEMIFIIFTKSIENMRKSENNFQKHQKNRKEAKFWTGLYYRLSSCITTWVGPKRRSLIGCFLTPVRYCLIP